MRYNFCNHSMGRTTSPFLHPFIIYYIGVPSGYSSYMYSYSNSVYSLCYYSILLLIYSQFFSSISYNLLQVSIYLSSQAFSPKIVSLTFFLQFLERRSLLTIDLCDFYFQFARLVKSYPYYFETISDRLGLRLSAFIFYFVLVETLCYLMTMLARAQPVYTLMASKNYGLGLVYEMSFFDYSSQSLVQSKCSTIQLILKKSDLTNSFQT